MFKLYANLLVLQILSYKSILEFVLKVSKALVISRLSNVEWQFILMDTSVRVCK